MTICTLCPEFFANSCNVPELMVDILFVFLQDNTFRVALDRNGKMIESFMRCAEGKGPEALQQAQEWIRRLSKLDYRSVEYVRYRASSQHHQSLALGLARRLKGFDANFVVWSEHDYAKKKLDLLPIRTIDRIGVKALLSGDRPMIELAVAGAAIKIIADSVGLVDRFYAIYKNSRVKISEGEAAPVVSASLGESIIASADGKSLTHIVFGNQKKLIKIEELANVLNHEDVLYIETLDKKLKSQLAIWASINKQIDTAGISEQARLEQNLDESKIKMREILTKILTFVEKIGFSFDNHYKSVREIVNSL